MLGMICFSPANAQFTFDYETNLISGVISNWSGNYVVGSNTVADLLRIENGGVLSDGFAYVGYESNAVSNSVILSDDNSIWTNLFTVYVGFSGSGNSLVVSNGGKLLSMAGFIGQNSNACSNRVVVTGPGSIWRNDYSLGLGDNGGSGNNLVISDGGQVITESGGDIGGWSGPANSNSVLVTDVGSIWSNDTSRSHSGMWIGEVGSDNHLVVSNGGAVISTEGVIGWDSTTTNNMAVVIDEGSIWRNEGDLLIHGGGNRLVVGEGGTVIASNVYVSFGLADKLNSIEIFGGNLLATNGTVIAGAASTGEINISNGVVLAQKLYVGYTNGTVGTLTMNGGVVATSRMTLGNFGGSTGSLFATDANLVCDKSAYIGGGGDGIMLLSNSLASFVGGIAVGGGRGARGTLTALDTTLYVSALSIGDGGGTGSVWITGGELTTATDATTYVSNFSPGQMTCSNSVVNLATLTVSASSYNAGTLTVIGGSLVARQFNVAHAGIGSVGAVWICDGASVTATNDPSIVVESGMGTMAISNSIVRLAALTLGKYFLVDTQGTLTVAGGTLTLAGTLTLGEEGIPSIPVGSKGTIWLTEGQLIATNAPSFIGVKGSGQVNISNGVFLAESITLAGGHSSLTLAEGKVSAMNVTIGTPDCDGTGTLTVSSGLFEVTNASHDAVLEVRSGTLIQNDGELIIDKLVITNACGHFIHSGGSLSIGTVVLEPSLDADGDGMPNGWEQSHGLDPLTPNADDDPDGDGLSNIQEFQLGTDPHDASSPYRITAITPEGANVRVTWTTVGGKTNFVQATSDPASNCADISGPIFIAGTTVTPTNYVDTGALTNFALRFYRIRIVQ